VPLLFGEVLGQLSMACFQSCSVIGLSPAANYRLLKAGGLAAASAAIRISIKDRDLSAVPCNAYHVY
jgi:hypothetical protein